MTTQRKAIPNTSIITNITDESIKTIADSLYPYMNDIEIVYHKDCLDGTVAAFTSWVFFGSNQVKKTPMSYWDPIPSYFLTTEKKLTLLILDFSFGPELLNRIAEAGHTVIVVDHHASAIDKITAIDKEQTKFWYFLSHEKLAVSDVHLESGASLSVRFFNYIYHEGVKLDSINRLISLTREHDLWLHKGDPTTDSMALAYWHKEKTADDLIKLFKTEPFSIELVDGLIAEGRARLDKAVAEIKEVIKCGAVVEINGNRAWLFYCERAYTSLAGSIVNQNYDIALSFYREGDKFKVSIRTAEGSFADASKFAMMYGGGGHKHAAGFYTDTYPAVLLKPTTP